MPLPAVHFMLAQRALPLWADTASFDIADAAARNAYYHGALGPDMGLFPGGEPILSELAHHFQPDELTRVLLGLARTQVQRAFACGWLTHMVADDALHPLIDAEAAGLVLVSGEDAGDPELVAAAHAQLELGLDIHVQRRDSATLRSTRLQPCFDAFSIRYLADGYRATYGLPFNPRWLLRSHRVVAPLAAALALLERTHARAAAEQSRMGVATLTLNAIRVVSGRKLSRQVAAFMNPVWPGERLLLALAVLEERFTRGSALHEWLGATPAATV